MAMYSANLPATEMRALIDMHGAAGVARAFLAAVFRRRTRGPAVPDRLRADVGLPPVEREVRAYWDRL